MSNTRTWTNINGEQEITEIGSERDLELIKKLNDAGFYIDSENKTRKKYMNFGQALELLKQNRSVRKSSWDQRRLRLKEGFLTTNEETLNNLNIAVSEEDIDGNVDITHVEGINVSLFNPHDHNIMIYPNIQMVTINGSIINGWTPSQVEMLAEDWEEVIWEEIR